MNGDAHGYPLHSPMLPDLAALIFPDWMGVPFPRQALLVKSLVQYHSIRDAL